MSKEMYLIGICDDDENYIEKFAGIIGRICTDENIPAKIVKFKSGEDVIGYHEKLDILILDEELSDQNHGLNGKDVRNILEERFVKTLIICVTAHERYMQDSFGQNVVGFVTKESEATGERFEYIFRQSLQKISGYNKVAYIEADGHYIEVNLFNGEIQRVRGAIEGITDKIKDSTIYIKCHRSYIVNLTYVDKIIGNFDELLLKDGTRIPIARAQKKEVKESYITFKEEKFKTLFGHRE